MHANWGRRDWRAKRADRSQLGARLAPIGRLATRRRWLGARAPRLAAETQPVRLIGAEARERAN